MADPTLVQLRAFAAVARERHFGTAADELAVTQPAVSAAVTSLEASLGGRLFERTPRGVFLTPLGESLLPTATRILASVGELADDAARSAQPHHGPLRLGVIPTIAPYVLPTVLTTLAFRYPDLVPEVSESTTAVLLEELDAGRLELLVLALPTDAADVVELPLYWEEFVLLVPEGHPLAGARDLPTSRLQGLDVLLLDEGHCLRDQAVDVCRQAGAAPHGAAKAASLTTLSQLVAARLGVTLLPASAASVEVRGPLATARFRTPTVPGRHVGLVHRRTTTKADEYAGLADVLRRSLAAALPVTAETAIVSSR